jgi:hypothetical protein
VKGALLGALSAFLVALLVACPTKPVPITPDAMDAGLDEAHPSVCRAMCAHLTVMGCPEGKDGGSECMAACENVQASGHFDLKPSCVAAASDIDAIRQCGTVRCVRP